MKLEDILHELGQSYQMDDGEALPAGGFTYAERAKNEIYIMLLNKLVGLNEPVTSVSSNPQESIEPIIRNQFRDELRKKINAL